MRNLKSCMLAGVALSCLGMGEAYAQQVFGAGSTFAAPTYRLLADCWGLPADAVGDDTSIDTGIVVKAISGSCASASGDSVGGTAQILFSPTGSGGGKQGLANHDPSNNGTTGIKTPSASNSVPFTSTFWKQYLTNGSIYAGGYPALQFAGSDDPWLASDQAKYVAAGGPTKYGSIVQLPAFAGAAVIAFNGKDGTGANLNILGTAPTGASSNLNLSRQALCGIFSGHITQWNNGILTALNGGTLGTGQITVVHRTDGSGTSFITTNGLIAQCSAVSGPNNESDTTVVSYAFPWTDRTAACKSGGFLPPVDGTDQANWPDLTTDQCSNAIPQPAGAAYSGQNGNAGVVAKIQSQNGAIGYSTTDYTQPVVPTGPKNANLQNQDAVNNGTATYVFPSSASVTDAMGTVIPLTVLGVMSNSDIGNPLNWSSQMVQPNPLTPAAYPLVGFTYLDFYQCIKFTNTVLPAGNPGSIADSNNLSIINSYLTFHYTDSHAANIVASQGFAPINNNNLSYWFDAVLSILSGPTALGNPGSGTCSSVTTGG